MREGVPATVDIINRTGVPEYVHWHGFEIPPELDGTEEEGSLAVPAGGRLQYEITPIQAGSRYVHSHAMTMNDLSRGVYSGQFTFVYVEPKRNPGRYDQEIFLSTHEWEPRLMMELDDESAEEDGDETEQRSMEIGYGVRSINGKALGHGEPLQVKQGQRILFHVLNASATENVQLHLPGHKFYVVALDGNPVPRPGCVSVLELGRRRARGRLGRDEQSGRVDFRLRRRQRATKWNGRPAGICDTGKASRSTLPPATRPGTIYASAGRRRVRSRMKSFRCGF